MNAADLIGVTSAVGSLGGITAIGLILRSAFRGVSDQWARIFETQERQISELQKDLTASREQQAADRARFEEQIKSLTQRFETELSAAKLEAKRYRADYERISEELRAIHRQMSTANPTTINVGTTGAGATA